MVNQGHDWCAFTEDGHAKCSRCPRVLSVHTLKEQCPAKKLIESERVAMSLDKDAQDCPKESLVEALRVERCITTHEENVANNVERYRAASKIEQLDRALEFWHKVADERSTEIIKLHDKIVEPQATTAANDTSGADCICGLYNSDHSPSCLEFHRLRTENELLRHLASCDGTVQTNTYPPIYDQCKDPAHGAR